MKHTKKITILHSNDLHGDFLAEQVDEKLVGGVSMLSGYIEKVRAEQPNTIYVIAGDMFRGSVIDSEYKGLSTIEIMNALAPDVVTIGNHEVDYGIAHLLFIEKCARFPIINANLYIKNTPTRLFTPYKILRMDGMNILFIGIITQDVINQTKSESLVGSFVDTAAAAAEVGKICNAHNSIDIDFTVLLTHIGFEEDRHLARQLDPAWGVDLIIGGHSHTLPEHAVEENGVVIAQAGTGTDQIGRFDIIVDTDNNCIDSYTWRTVPICAETCPRNPAMEQVLHRFTSQVDEKYSHIVGRFRRELTHPQRTQETELGNLFADIFTRSLGVDVMLIGSGSIRAEKLGPIVTYGDLIEGFPYDDGVFMFKVTGQQLRQMLHYMLREEAYTGHTEFYQLPSTLRLRYDRRKGDFDYFTYCGREVGKEIGDDALFTVGLQNYHFKNIESFFNISYDTLCKLQKPRSVATSCQDIPTVHLGPAAHQMEKRGVETFLGNLNRDIRAANSLMQSIRSAIRGLQRWIADLNEKKQLLLDALEKAKEPTLSDLLVDYFNLRAEQRSDWSGKAKLKCTVRDFEEVKRAVDYLKAHSLNTVEDLNQAIDSLNQTAAPLRKQLKQNENRMRAIAQIKDAAAVHAKLKPIHDIFIKKNFKLTKDAYAAQHKEELDIFNKAVRTLMKLNGSIAVDFSALDAEFSALQSSSAEFRTQLETLQPDISDLKSVRKYIDMVLNKQQLFAPGGKTPEKESVLKKLEQFQQKKSHHKTTSTPPNREESL